ncbi:MAG: CHAD domain-containing protein [Gammaproteobacteria bacterium]|nr:CHAD domain-containing protein [Gammaproteobacteria bacterium]MBU1625195.1 CHAD domain-containing protein [Gammaproteobacteria bacterium]MBU1981455.1 CHAD domain-containing protein [Gammaproteobacteria bacterium]
MAVETELKLHISPDKLQRLKRHPLLRTHSIERARTLKLYSIYYDTPKLTLQRHAMALRLRRVGKQWLQTLKGGGQSSAGLHQRNEWEMPVPAEQLDLEAFKLSGGKLPHGVRNHLQPVFVTDFTRNVRLLDFEGAQIELSMDSGEIRAGQGMCPISELELELKSGAPQQLFKLALKLLDIVPLEVEHTSKAAYGYRLFSASKPAVSKGKFAALQPSQDISSALKALIASCLSHIQSNVGGALLKLDDEYLHQVRVGLRRLRVVLSVTKRVYPGTELDDLYRQVSELCIALGRSRDWDVFVTQTLAPICARLPEHEGLRALLGTCERMRNKQHAGMESSLASQDFQRLLLRFGAWMHADSADSSQPSIEKFVRKILEKRSKQVLATGNTLSIENTKQFHALRIACKKLRYSLEMFGSLLPQNKYKAYLNKLTVLQDILGTMNDIAVAHRLLDELDNAARHDTLALVRGWMEHDYAEHITLFNKKWAGFVAQAKCW